jgi:hypothetical protein
MRKNRVGLIPIPTDANIEFFLEDLRQDHKKLLDALLDDLAKTVEETAEGGQPPIFAYGKLMNYLSSHEVKKPELIRLLAVALWELM